MVQEQDKTLRVLIAEKSDYSRLVLQDIIDTAAGLQVVGLAADGNELLLLQKEQKADIVVLDFELPRNEQLYTLKRIFSEESAPVLLLVAQEHLTLEMMQQALELGVYGIIIKPGSGHYINYRSLEEEVLLKLHAVRDSDHWDGERRLSLLHQVLLEMEEKPKRRRGTTADVVIVIGASTGGTQAVETIIRGFSPALKASVLVALHLPQRFTSNYIQRLKELTPLKVTEGSEGMVLKKGKIIVAPGGRTMVVRSVMGNEANLMISFTDEASGTYDLPSIDLLMKSVSKSAVPYIVGVILTGMGKDGTVGASYIQHSGGMMIAQNEESSAIFGMARSAIESGYIDKVLPLSEIPHFLNRYVAERHQVSATDSAT
jgi:two-component system chemotaxis response regulator CheB